jgi:hypothetical protein
MKNNLFILLLSLGIATATMGQKTNVPEAVSKAFNSKFPGATEVKWGKENAKEYEAEFKLKNTAISANFGTDGSWKETETTINASDLPVAVTKAIQTKYPGAVINLAEKVEKPEKTYYETVIKVNNKKKEIEISAEGKIM